MCLGTIATVADVWDEEGAPLCRLADGAVVSLALVPSARPGDRVLVHLGIPVEVIAADLAEDALALRAAARLDDGRGSP